MLEDSQWSRRELFFDLSIDNLSRTLQNKKCSAAEGQQIADMVVKRILQLERCINGYKTPWAELSACHREAVEAIIKIPATNKPIGVHLSQEYAAEQAKTKSSSYGHCHCEDMAMMKMETYTNC